MKNHPFAAWSTSRLAGLNFTFPEVQTIMSGMTVGGHPLHDLDEVRAIAEAWGLVVREAKKRTPVTREIAERINGIVRTPEGDYQAPAREDLDGAWAWWEEHAPADAARRALLRVPFMARAQFFCDGNKRTAVMSASLELVTHGYMPFTVSGNKQLEWHQALTELFMRDDAAPLIGVLEESAQPL